MFRILFIIIGVNFFPSFVQAESQNNYERWQAVVLGEKKIGYRWIKTEYRKKRVTTREVFEIKTKVPGEPVRNSKIILDYVETRDGKVISIDKKVQSESANYSMQGRVKGKEFQVKLRSKGSSEIQQFPIPDDFLAPHGLQKKIMASSGLLNKIEYSSWSFSSLQFEKHTLSWRKHLLPENPDVQWLLEKTREDDSAKTWLYANNNFIVLREQSSVAGKPLLIDTCDKACALSSSAPLKNVYSLLIRSPYKIPEHMLKKRIRYTLQSEFPLDPPDTFEQKVVLIPGGAQIEVCNDCGEERAPDESELAAALEDNFWLDYNNPALKLRAEKLRGAEPISAEKLMKRMETFVSRHMKKGPIDYSGYAPASEAYQNKSGDCTEQAVLLAALGRAVGVPTRVAIGLAYSNERFFGRSYVFVPHAWVQAWVDDKWVSYDSGMEDFTSGHIVLGLSDGEQGKYMEVMRQLHALEITSAAQLKKRSRDKGQ